ncbi:hypothetical protein [Tardiphaga sp. P9-11]|jgi:hypothetical protein|uniref:hypothetical protein n=1 Tax=Tardiphaga sp. P9-11 TaxID=2024614 RepID=UPI0011F287E3|nr:hypothetical protein [Tardiphaga sp. P9-11]
MICCLLALFAALPGVALIKRMRAGRTPRGHCASICTVGLRRDIALAMATAGIIVALTATAMPIHTLNHTPSPRAWGPICSALDRISPASSRDLRQAASYR